MKFTKPLLNATFLITSAPDWPSILFETDAAGSHTWDWSIDWGGFKQSGKATTINNKWDAKTIITNFGGTLTVKASANKVTASISVIIKGTNPSELEVIRYLSTKPNSNGFDKLIKHETKFTHFKNNEPITSFDKGYGICQLTNPLPTFDQIWNWKRNVDGGLILFGAKRAIALKYLSQFKRSYTPKQLMYETVCRWNGGHYHEWDIKSGAWIRNAIILCDTQTGNIGWNLTDVENKGKTETDLHKRDKDSYKTTIKTHWNYYGICYADKILA
ncbi:MAG: hypothetical protein NTV00_03270 [Methylococcales bacterium]|nr:hypothetical protein [Methylococcales bacterium]